MTLEPGRSLPPYRLAERIGVGGMGEVWKATDTTRVSTNGGFWPRFSRRGDKLYYILGDSIMEVDVALGAEPKLGAPRELFRRKPLGWGLVFGWPPGFDVSPDGSRFVFSEGQADVDSLTGIIVEENWSEEFRK